MPEADGRIRPAFYSLSEEEWERIFGPEEDEPELDTDEPEYDIVWTPDPSLDGAWFEASEVPELP